MYHFHREELTAGGAGQRGSLSPLLGGREPTEGEQNGNSQGRGEGEREREGGTLLYILLYSVARHKRKSSKLVREKGSSSSSDKVKVNRRCKATRTENRAAARTARNQAAAAAKKAWSRPPRLLPPVAIAAVDAVGEWRESGRQPGKRKNCRQSASPSHLRSTHQFELFPEILAPLTQRTQFLVALLARALQLQANLLQTLRRKRAAQLWGLSLNDPGGN